MTTLTHTDPRLRDALGVAVAEALGRPDPVLTDTLHTGGGVMVTAVDLSQDGRFQGRQLWLTREEDWLLGFYDFTDPEDEGICVVLPAHRVPITSVTPPEWGTSADDPQWVAGQVAGIVKRLGVTLGG